MKRREVREKKLSTKNHFYIFACDISVAYNVPYLKNNQQKPKLLIVKIIPLLS